MKVYSVNEVIVEEFGEIAVDICCLHIASSLENAMGFIKEAVEDESSGIEKDTILQVDVENVDSYFSMEDKSLGRKSAESWLV